MALEKAVKAVALGALRRGRFREGAVETAADAILVSSLYVRASSTAALPRFVRGSRSRRHPSLRRRQPRRRNAVEGRRNVSGHGFRPRSPARNASGDGAEWLAQDLRRATAASTGRRIAFVPSPDRSLPSAFRLIPPPPLATLLNDRALLIDFGSTYTKLRAAISRSAACSAQVGDRRPWGPTSRSACAPRSPIWSKSRQPPRFKYRLASSSGPSLRMLRWARARANRGSARRAALGAGPSCGACAYRLRPAISMRSARSR